MDNKTLQAVKDKFEELFPADGEYSVYFAPGRVNLIGEHVDYNGGHVFPCALDIGTYAAVRKRCDRKLRMYSLNFQRLGVVEASLDSLRYDKAYDWANYVFGVIGAFEGRGYRVDCGMDIVFCGNIPNASGLSSSASLEVLTGFVIRDMFSFDSVNRIELALIGQEAENKFIGVSCGIMDQFAIAMGKAGHAVCLDTATLDYTYAPLHLDSVRLVIINTNKRRGLGDSKYNERCAECAQAVEALRKFEFLKNLCELTPQRFEEGKRFITDPTIRKRARHIVYENQRTIDAVQALKTGNLVQFGQLMTASHNSLRDDYEVTGKELDTVVASALRQKGVLGARMTGAGFGGCAVALVREEDMEAFEENVAKDYREQTGLDAGFYVVEAGDGPQKLL